MPTAMLVPDPTLSGTQLKALVDALGEAFPGYDDLQMMVLYQMNVKLERIVAQEGMSVVAFKFVRAMIANGRLRELVAAARAANPGNAALAAVADQLGQGIDTGESRRLERVVRESLTFADVAKWRARLGEIEVQVARVEVQTSDGPATGTGFLVGPDLLLTNHHVVTEAIASVAAPPGTAATGAAGVSVRFDYKVLPDGSRLSAGRVVTLASEDWLVDSSPYSQVDLAPEPKPGQAGEEELDYALLRLAEPVGSESIDPASPVSPKRGWMPLSRGARTLAAQSPLVIVQHPDGKPMKLAYDSQAIRGTSANGTRVTYTTNTEAGSSGSPCFDQDLRLVALHHAGDPNYAPLYQPAFNEGIPIWKIAQLLEKRKKAGGLTLT